jgi:hypothetical protein
MYLPALSNATQIQHDMICQYSTTMCQVHVDQHHWSRVLIMLYLLINMALQTDSPR